MEDPLEASFSVVEQFIINPYMEDLLANDWIAVPADDPPLATHFDGICLMPCPFIVMTMVSGRNLCRKIVEQRTMWFVLLLS